MRVSNFEKSAIHLINHGKVVEPSFRLTVANCVEGAGALGAASAPIRREESRRVNCIVIEMLASKNSLFVMLDCSFAVH